MFDKPRPADLHVHKLEALGHFAGGIAHDFNNILSIIEGYTTRALRQLDQGELSPETLQKIILSTQRGAGLTRQLLAFARQNVDMNATLSLREGLQQQEVLLRPLLGENIMLSLPHVDQNIYLRISADQFTQILLNLAINARDAMSGAGAFHVTARQVGAQDVPVLLRSRVQENAYIRLSVSDNGCGMSAEDIPHIFDPFFTTKRQGATSGTGLGLSVVYGIVDQIGGMIDVQSTLGQGTTFDLYLPLADPPAAVFDDVSTEKKTTPGLAGRTILLAEDEPELRDVLSLMLDDLQMKVLPAANGNEALRMQAAYEGEIDFLLTDIVMPGMDGLHLSDLFMRDRPDANVVLMSGYPFLDGGGTLQVPAGADFISKPFQEDKMRLILERALSRKTERLENTVSQPPQPTDNEDGTVS